MVVILLPASFKVLHILANTIIFIFCKRIVLHGDCKTMQYENDDELDKLLADKRFAKRQNNSPRIAAAPFTLTDSNFEQAIQKYPLIVVDFWAPWCGPCRMLGPTIEQLAGEFAGKVIFGKLNVDENPRVAGSFGIQSIPTVVIFKNGQPVDGFVGVASKPQIQSKILQYLGNGNGGGLPYA